ncbi:TrbG/VirB9 family P-type conjugative transfer protein [Pectinatus frisingensis]|uniref:TrbG/VirB9 family P-type conjugative transfer protein n=1 Tax=Pectinatus frisingensis TaxID=865 RepID=UPI003D805CD6
MILSKNIKKKIALMVVTTSFSFAFMNVNYTYAADQDIDSLIQNQQQILNQLNEKKAQKANDEISTRISDLENELKDINSRKQYDAEGAVNALATQINDLKNQLSIQTDAQQKIMDELKKIEDQQMSQPVPASDSTDNSTDNNVISNTKYLINPGPSADVSYTQDAVNSQGNSTMTFKYAPNQLYKIYCRTGYLTDLSFKPGEKIKFVGGGDTSAWAVNSTEVNGVPHLYVKPVVQTSATNLIVTTDKHSYQIILNTSDWYNPMVTWTYENEDHIANMIQQQNDAKTTTDKFNATSYDQLNFDYLITGDGDKPTMVFDDGTKTIIKFKNLNQKMPALFIREQGKKVLSLVNYDIKDNCYIINKIFSNAELRYSDKEIIKIKRK